jgi:hypothetical protein
MHALKTSIEVGKLRGDEKVFQPDFTFPEAIDAFQFAIPHSLKGYLAATCG